MEARTKSAENRAMGIKETKDGNIKVDESISLSKTEQFNNYITNLVNDVRVELRKADNDYTPKEEAEYEEASAIDAAEDAEALKEFIGRTVEDLKKMETDWSKSKKDDKLTNMPFLGDYKKSIEGRRENPPPQVEKQYGAKRNPRPDPNGYRNPPNRRVPKD